MIVYSLFTTCLRGLKEPLATELQVLGCTDVRSVDGGVSRRGAMEQVYRINLWSRVISRVLPWLAKGSYRNERDIYKLAKNIDWAARFAPEQTFKIKVEGKRANVKSLNFVDLKIKDALCDVLRETCGIRLSVDKARPDVRAYAFAGECEVQIFLDTSGEALFKRGCRQNANEVQLCENLAAGLLLLVGRDGTQSFQDPFYGGGTIAIGAAWIAAGRASGLMCRFGFEKLKDFGRGAWEEIRRQATARIKPPSAALSGSDNDRCTIHTAQASAQMAEADGWIEWDVCDAQAARPNGEGGIMISNPSYGVRLAEVRALQALYSQLGTWLKQYYVGWLMGVLTADRNMPKSIRLSLKRKIPPYNDNLDCRLFPMDMMEGSNR